MVVPFAVPSRDDVAEWPILQAQNFRVKVRRVPSARSVVVPQDEIHDVGLAVEQAEQTHPKHDALHGILLRLRACCTARSAVCTRRHVVGRAPCGSALDSRASPAPRPPTAPPPLPRQALLVRRPKAGHSVYPGLSGTAHVERPFKKWGIVLSSSSPAGIDSSASSRYSLGASICLH